MVGFLMFTTLIGKYKPDSDLATVIDDSSSLPPSVSPQRGDRECSPKIIVIDSPRFRYASDGRRESLLESRWLAGWSLWRNRDHSTAGSFTMLWRINVITRYANVPRGLGESAGSMRARQTSVLPEHLPCNLHLVFRLYLRVIPITSPNEARRM